MALARKQARRSALRTTLNQVTDKTKIALQEIASTEAKLMGLKSRLEINIENLGHLDDEIVSSLEAEAVAQDAIESVKVSEPTHELLASLQLKIEKFRLEAVKESRQDSERASSSSSLTRSCKLPKLELIVFKGDILQWRSFEEQFLKTFHENEGLSDIDKFIYLKRYLANQALAVVSGLSLTGTNYKEPLELLRGRYGNPQVLIPAYMEFLLKLGKVKSMADINGLRKLSNDIENCVRNLRSMNVETATYGSLLIPILKERLPDDLVIQISRRFGSDIWTLDLLLQYMNSEIQASENCVSLLRVSSHSHQEKSTAFNLNVSTERDDERKCVFCLKEGHSPSQCRKVTNVKSRVDILMKKRRCFVCLRSGHQKRDCSLKFICKNCNGRHHISICYGKPKSEQSEKVVNQNLVMTTRSEGDAILLETATATVYDCYDRSRETVRILFDGGSQRTFITVDLRERLGLKTERVDKVKIGTFGAGETVAKELEVVKLKAIIKIKAFLLLWMLFVCQKFLVIVVKYSIGLNMNI